MHLHVERWDQISQKGMYNKFYIIIAVVNSYFQKNVLHQNMKLKLIKLTEKKIKMCKL